MDEPLLYGEIAKDRNPGAYTVAGTPLVHENYACMMRKDDPAFKHVVDGVIAKLQTSARPRSSTTSGSCSRFRRRA